MRQEGVLQSQRRRWDECKSACAKGMADFFEAKERVVHVMDPYGACAQGSLRMIQVVQLDTVGGKPLPGGKLDLDQASQDDLKRVIGVFSLDQREEPVRTERIVVRCKAKDPAPWGKFPAALASTLRVRRLRRYFMLRALHFALCRTPRRFLFARMANVDRPRVREPCLLRFEVAKYPDPMHSENQEIHQDVLRQLLQKGMSDCDNPYDFDDFINGASQEY